MRKCKSINHLHILSSINSELGRFGNQDVIRILDVGCGNSDLIAYLAHCLPTQNPDVSFEVYGFEVADFGANRDISVRKAREFLSAEFPSVDWSARISVISIGEPWPWPDELFHVIVSNQVLEHVGDHESFFGEVERTLRYGGFSVHNFPLKYVIYESHLKLPFAHFFSDFEKSRAYIRMLSWIRFPTLMKYKQKHPVSRSHEEFSEGRSDYLLHYTNYVGKKDLFRCGKKSHLRVSFKYTPEYYKAKLRSMLSLKERYEYKNPRSAAYDSFLFFFLKYVSSITLFLEKKDTYRDYVKSLPTSDA